MRNSAPDLLLNQTIQADILAAVSASTGWQQFSGSTVLITGASGFLPAYMVETLLYLNRNVLLKPVRIIGLVRNSQAARERFGRYLHCPDLELIFQDVCHPVDVPPETEFIIHAASQASPRYYATDPVGTLSPNTVGTFNLLRAAEKLTLKGFLFFSSAEIYGTLPNAPQSITEDYCGSLDSVAVRSCYPESKRMGEAMCAAWSHQHGIPTRIVRPFHTYGPGMRLDDGRVFADFVRDVLSGGPIVMNGDGRSRRCFCYLGDANSAFFTVLLRGADGNAYNVANPEGDCSIGALAELLADMYRSDGITIERKFAPQAAESPHSGLPSIEKTKALGWQPSTGIKAGFHRTIESYRH